MEENKQNDKKSNGDIYLKPSRLARAEIIPVKYGDRTITWFSFTAIWFTMTAQMGVFALGASMAEAMPTLEAILAVIIANVAMIFFLVPIGDIGIEHGINFAGYLRVPFGLKGSYLPLSLRALAGIAWFGIQTYLGATAIEEVATVFFDVSAIYVWYVLFGAIQIAIVAAGLETIKKVVNIAAPALGVLSIVLLYIMFSKGSFKEFFQNEVVVPQPFIVGVVSNLSYWATVAINLPDFTRNVKTDKSPKFMKRNKHSIIAQAIGVPLGMLFFTVVGMAGFIFTGESNPVLAIATLTGGALLMLALGVVILAQLSTNITANLFASAYAANAIGSPKISYSKGAIITGILGLLTFPWLLLDFFLTYLPIVGAALAPLAGIMIADYYLVRKRQINVPDIFNPKGQYRYWKGVNPASFLAWVTGAIAGIVFLEYSFIVALPIGFIIYYLLMHYWIVKQYKLPEIKEGEEKLLATSEGKDWPIFMD